MEYVYESDSAVPSHGVIEAEQFPPGFQSLPVRSRPRMLHVSGELSLFWRVSVMVCGARDASEEALDFSYRCGRLIADAGLVAASGYARGVDMAAHRGALEAGGETVAFLPFGLARFRLHRDLTEVFDPRRFLAVTEEEDFIAFSTRAALKRNKLLAAHAAAVIVVEPGDSGGTWYSAEKAAELDRPLFFLEGERPETVDRLESLGGKRIVVRNGAPDLGEVFANLTNHETRDDFLTG